MTRKKLVIQTNKILSWTQFYYVNHTFVPWKLIDLIETADRFYKMCLVVINYLLSPLTYSNDMNENNFVVAIKFLVEIIGIKNWQFYKYKN